MDGSIEPRIGHKGQKICLLMDSVLYTHIHQVIHMRVPGIEPESRPWQGRVLPLNHTRVKDFSARLNDTKE